MKSFFSYRISIEFFKTGRKFLIIEIYSFQNNINSDHIKRSCTELKDDTLSFDVIGKEGKISLKALTNESAENYNVDK